MKLQPCQIIHIPLKLGYPSNFYYNNFFATISPFIFPALFYSHATTISFSLPFNLWEDGSSICRSHSISILFLLQLSFAPSRTLLFHWILNYFCNKRSNFLNKLLLAALLSTVQHSFFLLPIHSFLLRRFERVLCKEHFVLWALHRTYVLYYNICRLQCAGYGYVAKANCFPILSTLRASATPHKNWCVCVHVYVWVSVYVILRVSALTVCSSAFSMPKTLSRFSVS